jgi:hypothetical protein
VGASSRHSNVAPGSLDVNANDGARLLVRPLGPDVIVAVGAVVSTVNERVAAVPTLFAESMARTENV